MRHHDDPITRREFLAAASALGVVACARLPRGAARETMLVHVGTYTAQGRTTGIYTFRMASDSGALEPLGAIDAGPNPSFLALRRGQRELLAVNETTEHEGRPTGTAIALALGASGPTGPLGVARETGGGAPCYVSVDATGRWALVANYVGGSAAVLPIGADGALGAATTVVRFTGRGPNAARQEAPHAHCIIPDPTNRFVLVSDLGTDRVMVYRFDAATGALAPAPTPFVSLEPGAGPRHLAFHPNGRLLFAITELDHAVTSFRWDDGRLTPLGTVPLLEAAPAGEATAAHIVVAPSGRFVYASVRGPDLLVVLALDPDTGALTVVQRQPTGGRWPRNFALDASGRWLLAANQRSNDLFVFRVDPATGRLTPTGVRVDVPSPVCVLFAS